MAKKTSSKNALTLERTWPYILTIGGLIGFVAAFVLTVEKIELFKNPNYVPTCNLSPLLSCGSVMKTHQAAAFGFPNSLIGMMGFAVVTTIGMILLAGVDASKVKRWFWLGLQAGTIFGIGFVTWLQYQSIFTIKALCPYCMVVWTVMIPIFLYTTLYNLRTGVIPTPGSLKKFVAFLQRHHGDILVVWYGLIIFIILNHFWYYWKTLI
jgi:uncharacterized membrane protein